MIQDIEDKFKKCFELAVQGETLAFPNPNVACLIYYKEELIAYGIHREFGKAHAEVNAINKAKEYFSSHLRDQFASFQDFASNCELILNLEPCSHYGNTPPCTSLIKESGFKKIAFGAYDTNPIVFKKSLEEFPSSEYEVIKPEDLNPEIQNQAMFINRAFFAIKAKEAKSELAVYITVKIASYADGNMIAKEKWITGDEARKDVHRLRSTNQILITTSSTIKTDKPKYNVRHKPSELGLLDVKDPDICVLYNKGEIELDEIKSSRKVIYEKIESLDKEALEKIIHKLSFQGYQKIIVEAGPRLSHAFLESGLVDELVVYQPKGNRNKEKFLEDLKSNFPHKAPEVFDFETDYKAILLR